MAPDKPQYAVLTVTQAAMMLGVERKSILSYIHAGHLPAMDVRRPGSERATFRIARADVDGFTAIRRVKVGPPAPRRLRRKAKSTTRQWV